MSNDNVRTLTSADPNFSIAGDEDQTDELNERNGARQEKIQKLVSDGAKNYPAYLKLIYTGESELSSEDETAENRPARLKMNRVMATVGSTRQKQPLTTAIGKVSASRGVNLSGMSANLPNSAILSPESNKLLDPGSEKPMSPNEVVDLTGLQASADDVRSNGVSPFYDSSALADERDQSDQWQLELLKIQDDITTLRGVLQAKLQIAADLKRKLGITPFTELKQSVRHFKDTDTYQKTNAVFKHFGVFATKKMANFRQRTSAAFKSSEEPEFFSSDLTKQDGCQLMSSKSETNVADFSSSGRKPRR